MEEILQYYGLDWCGLIFGLVGSYLITRQNRVGFLYNLLGCACGLAVALMSGQYGFITYNGILIVMMGRGYIGWAKKQNEATAPLGAE